MAAYDGDGAVGQHGPLIDGWHGEERNRHAHTDCRILTGARLVTLGCNAKEVSQRVGRARRRVSSNDRARIARPVREEILALRRRSGDRWQLWLHLEYETSIRVKRLA